MKRIRSMITLLLMAAAVASPITAPFVQVYLSGSTGPQRLLRILQISQQGLALSTSKSNSKKRKNTV